MRGLELSVMRRSLRAPVAPEPAGTIALVLELDHPAAKDMRDRLEAEAFHARATPIAGTIPLAGTSVQGERITLYLGAIPDDAVRLDALFAMLARRGSPFGSAVSAHVIERVASTVGAIHRAGDASGAPRVHGFLSKHAIFVVPSGAIFVAGFGLPLLDALLVPAPETDVDRFRYLAPEVARGLPAEGRSNIYSLAVMYYELLAGRPYRAALNSEEIYLRALEGHPADVPDLLPDPRPQLLEILRAALDAHPDRRFSVMESFGAAVRGEASGAGARSALWGSAREPDQAAEGGAPKVAPGPEARAELGRFIGEFAIDRAVARGASGLIADETPVLRPQAAIGMARSPHVIARSIAPAAPEPAPPKDDWMLVLGDEPTVAEGAAPIIITEPKETKRERPMRVESVPPVQRPLKLELPAPAPAPAAVPALLPEVKPALAPAENPLASLAMPFPEKHTPKIGTKQIFMLRLGAVAIVLLACVGMFFSMKRSMDAPDRDDPNGSTLRSRMRKAAKKARGAEETKTEEAAGSEPVPAPVTAPRYAIPAPDAGEAPKPAGLLSVFSNPSGASVEIDGGYVGTTPLIIKHHFDKPEYEVTIQLDGYKPWKRPSLVDQEKDSLSVVANLEPIAKPR